MRGDANSRAEILHIIHAYSNGEMGDAEMTPWLRAIYDNGMSDEETLAIVEAMLNSGESLDFSQLNRTVVDKHSTGGVGDKVSLILAPILAACGLAVPMISGKSLGHTGGTLDKLASIPGYRTDLSLSELRRTVERVGVSMTGQTEELCPADRKIYALRDRTDTIASTPLIGGSIMSKKIAEGIEALALNITVGNGAFMKTMEEAEALGETLRMVGEHFGIATTILYSRMDQPLGREAGLWNEVQESVACLKGEGEADLMAVVRALAEPLLAHAGVGESEHAVDQSIRSGTALGKLEEMVEAHGGDPSSLEQRESIHHPSFETTVDSVKSGTITVMDAEQIGWAVNRMTIFDEMGKRTLDPSAGVRFEKKVGESVEGGELIAVCRGNREAAVETAAAQIRSAIEIRDGPFTAPDVII